MTIINHAETPVSFKKIAASICDTVFDAKGYYRNEELWQVKLFALLHYELIDKNHILYNLFDGILKTKNENRNHKNPQIYSEIIFHIKEEKSDY